MATNNDSAIIQPMFGGRQQKVSPLSEEVTEKFFPGDFHEDDVVLEESNSLEDK